jgi:hypothetical protein
MFSSSSAKLNAVHEVLSKRESKGGNSNFKKVKMIEL